MASIENSIHIIFPTTLPVLIYPADKYESKVGFDTVKARIKSLCLTPGARELVEGIEFSSRYDTVRHRLVATAEMMAIESGDDPLPIIAVNDIASSLSTLKVAGTFLTAQELVSIRRTMQCVADIASFFERHRSEDGVSQFPELSLDAVDLEPTPMVVTAINRIVDQYGEVKDSASPELAEIRRQLQSTSGTINSIMRRVIARAVSEGYLESDTTPSVRDGRLVLPVAPAFKRKIGGIVHDESASGKTYFIEPAEIVEANNRVRELQMDERREIIRLLILLADQLRPFIEPIASSLATLATLDFLRAKAHYAMEIGGTLPRLERGTELEWYHATHPVLLDTLKRQGKEIVPLDITLTSADRLLIISGPNAGGKSVCLKTVGIVQYMAQCGILPPLYENSHVGIFESIFIDIGDDQSLEDDLSTYSSHLKNMKFFLAHGSSSTLALIDEFGAGTEPLIGGALAQAILVEFNRLGMWGVINTHFTNIKQLAETTPGLVNGSMLYDRHLMQPMFKLAIGSPGSSFAIEIARKIGLPSNIISEAETIVGSDYVNVDKYLLDIARDKRYWENKRLSIKQKEKKIDNVLASYEEDATTLREKRREIIAEAREEARRILEGSNAAIERTIHEIKTAQAEREATIAARKRLAQERVKLESDNAGNHPLLAKAPKSKKSRAPKPLSQSEAPLKVGDNVKLDGQGEPGRILEISGKQAVVAFGLMKTNVKLERLKRTMSQPKSGAGNSSFISAATIDSQRDKQLQFKQEIDVRGMRADEAIQAVTYFIDDALQFNSQRVRILHGTGTGALRQAIRQYLSTVPGVADYHDEDVRFGGAGITVVNL
ncbi:MAG: Smr/MutS family protein [Clostridiales bacterium]|nr:Smr/MutS family protein [Clostridiales bacterium]